MKPPVVVPGVPGVAGFGGPRLGPADWPGAGTQPGPVVSSWVPGGAAGAGVMPDPAEIEADPILVALRELGLVQGSWRLTTMGWGYDIECPWVGEHTSRIVSGTAYVPVLQRFHCHHGHCQTRGMAEVRERLDELLRAASGTTLAALEFDAVDPATVPLPPRASAFARTSDRDALDPWDEPPGVAWPGNIFTPEVETEIAACAAHHGFDHAGLATAVLAAGSAAADKRLVLRPYQGINWTVPPILWAMLVGDSGSMKTAIWKLALEPVQAAHNAAMTRWETSVAHYWRQPPLYRQINPPPEMTPLLVNDATVESVQARLVHTLRGMAYWRDEMSELLNVDRYSQNGSGAGVGRAFLLESYEANPFTLIRVKRGGLHLKNCALMIGGGIQPELLREHLRNTGDGLMQRFTKVRITRGPRGGTPGAPATGGVVPEKMAQAHEAIERLLTLVPFDDYCLTPEGEALVRRTEDQGRAMAEATPLGSAFAAECHKAHGLHARCALVLHLLGPTHTEALVLDETVARARQFVVFSLEQSARLYAHGSPRQTIQAIASYLLRLLPAKITTRDLQRNVAVCRNMTTKEMNAALEPLVDGGWVVPAEPYPTNRMWSVNPGLQNQFPERLALERARVATIKDAMCQN